MGSVNVNNFADGVPPIHLANVENIKKLGVFLTEVRGNILVALHLQCQTLTFPKFKLKLTDTYLVFTNQLYI